MNCRAAAAVPADAATDLRTDPVIARHAHALAAAGCCDLLVAYLVGSTLTAPAVNRRERTDSR